MIRLYLVRHGIAVDGSPDESRALSDKGRRRFRRAARAFSKLGEPPTLILTSPLVRAVQTAEILAGALKLADVQVIEELHHQFPPKAVLARLAGVADGASIALVGHEPQMSGLIATLTGTRETLEVRKGSIVCLDCESLPTTTAVCRWWLKPRSRVLSEGLPTPAQKPKS